MNIMREAPTDIGAREARWRGRSAWSSPPAGPRPLVFELAAVPRGLMSHA